MMTFTRTILLSFALFILAFLGFIVGFVLRPNIVNAVFPSKVSAVGTVQQTLYSAQDKTASVLPPEGFYIENAATDRVYIFCKPEFVTIEVGQNLRIYGTLDTLCGPDSVPCYPRVTGSCES